MTPNSFTSRPVSLITTDEEPFIYAVRRQHVLGLPQSGLHQTFAPDGWERVRSETLDG